jgi:hypothetical protein
MQQIAEDLIHVLDQLKWVSYIIIMQLPTIVFTSFAQN